MTATRSYNDPNVFRAISNIDAKEINDKDAVYARLNAAYRKNKSIGKFRDSDFTAGSHAEGGDDCLIRAARRNIYYAVEWLLDENLHPGHRPDVEHFNQRDGSALYLAMHYADNGEDKKQEGEDATIRQNRRNIQKKLIPLIAPISPVRYWMASLLETAHKCKNFFFLQEYLIYYNKANPKKVKNPGTSDTLRIELIRAIATNQITYLGFLITTYPTLYSESMRNPYNKTPPLLEAINKGRYEVILILLTLPTAPPLRQTTDSFIKEEFKLFKKLNIEEALEKSALKLDQKTQVKELLEKKYYPLMHAVKTTAERDVTPEKMTAALKDSPDIHCKDPITGTDAFKEAIKKNPPIPTLVQWFLDEKLHPKATPNKTDKDKNGYTAYMHAVNFADDDKDSKGDQNTAKRREIQAMVLEDFKPDWDTVHVAVKAKNYSFVAQHTKLFWRELMMYAIENDDERIFNATKIHQPQPEPTYDKTPQQWNIDAITLAIKLGKTKFVEHLLNPDIDWNTRFSNQSWTNPYVILYRAAFTEKTCSIKNAITIAKIIHAKNVTHQSPDLDWLVENLNLDFMAILNAARMYANLLQMYSSSSYSHLEIAITCNRLNIVSYILDCLDEEIENKHFKGRLANALPLALHRGHLAIFKALLMEPKIPYLHENKTPIERKDEFNKFLIGKGEKADKILHDRTQLFAVAYNSFYKQYSDDTLRNHLKLLLPEDIQSLKYIFTARKETVQLNKLLELKPELNNTTAAAPLSANVEERPPAVNPEANRPPAINPAAIPTIDQKISAEGIRPAAPSINGNNSSPSAILAEPSIVAPGGPDASGRPTGPQPSAAPPTYVPTPPPTINKTDTKQAEPPRAYSPTKFDDKKVEPIVQPTVTTESKEGIPNSDIPTVATVPTIEISAINPTRERRDSAESSTEGSSQRESTSPTPPSHVSDSSTMRRRFGLFEQAATTVIVGATPTAELSEYETLTNTARLMGELLATTLAFHKHTPIDKRILNNLKFMFTANQATLSQNALESLQKEGQTPPQPPL